jgi:hypothetical protein
MIHLSYDREIAENPCLIAPPSKGWNSAPSRRKRGGKRGYSFMIRFQ